MSNPSRQKGTKFRAEIRDYLCATVFPDCTAAPEWGALDEGDLLGTGPVVFELKCVPRAYDLSGWLAEATVEAQNASKRRKKTLLPAVIHKRRGKGKPEDAGVYMRLEDFVKLLGEPK